MAIKAFFPRVGFKAESAVSIGKDRWLMRQIMDDDSVGFMVLFAALEVGQDG